VDEFSDLDIETATEFIKKNNVVSQGPVADEESSKKNATEVINANIVNQLDASINPPVNQQFNAQLIPPPLPRISRKPTKQSFLAPPTNSATLTSTQPNSNSSQFQFNTPTAPPLTSTQPNSNSSQFQFNTPTAPPLTSTQPTNNSSQFQFNPPTNSATLTSTQPTNNSSQFQFNPPTAPPLTSTQPNSNSSQFQFNPPTAPPLTSTQPTNNSSQFQFNPPTTPLQFNHLQSADSCQPCSSTTQSTLAQPQQPVSFNIFTQPPNTNNTSPVLPKQSLFDLKFESKVTESDYRKLEQLKVAAQKDKNPAETIALLNLKLNRAKNVIKLLETISSILGFTANTSTDNIKALLNNINTEQASYVNIGPDILRPDLTEKNMLIFKSLTDKDKTNPAQVLQVVIDMLYSVIISCMERSKWWSLTPGENIFESFVNRIVETQPKCASCSGKNLDQSIKDILLNETIAGVYRNTGITIDSNTLTPNKTGVSTPTYCTKFAEHAERTYELKYAKSISEAEVESILTSQPINHDSITYITLSALNPGNFPPPLNSPQDPLVINNILRSIIKHLILRLEIKNENLKTFFNGYSSLVDPLCMLTSYINHHKMI